MKRLISSILPYMICMLALVVIGCGTKSVNEVTIYVSEDQVFSEPILKDFERETGITVKMVFDTEESKSTGVMNRLIAEKDNPQADVYWANEPIRAEVLKQKGIASPYVSSNAQGIPERFKDPDGYWTGFSARVRVLLVRTDVSDKPRSILSYTDSKWKDKSVIANPLFGTTTAQVAALFTAWGNERAKTFMEEMKKNSVRLSTSNGESADFVASGQSDFSLVDSDDGVNRMRQGKSVEMIYPDQGESEAGCFVVPNAVVLINGAPHSENAKKLIDYLLSKETERKLAFADCAQIPLNADVQTPPDVKRIGDLKTMSVNYADVAKMMTEIQPYLKNWVGY